MHVPPGAVLPAVQLSGPRTKSPALAPPTLTPLNASAPADPPLPLFVTVSVTCVPADAPAPVVALPKLMLLLEGAIEMPAIAAVPDSGTCAGLPPGTLSVADRLPAGCDTAGLNDTLTLQLLPAPRTGPQGSSSTKSPLFVPLIEISVISAAMPPAGFAIVTVSSALNVPSLCGPNATLVGDTCNVGGGRVAVPLSVTACGLPEALSAKFKLALFAPAESPA